MMVAGSSHVRRWSEKAGGVAAPYADDTTGTYNALYTAGKLLRDLCFAHALGGKNKNSIMITTALGEQAGATTKA